MISLATHQQAGGVVTAIRQVVGAIGALAVLAACGGGSDSERHDGGDSDFAKESASAIEKASIEDMKAARGRAHARVRSPSRATRSVSTFAHHRWRLHRHRLRGDSGSAEVVTLDGTSYFKPDEEFWKAQAGPAAEQIISTVGDEWVQLLRATRASPPSATSTSCSTRSTSQNKPSEKGATEMSTVRKRSSSPATTKQTGGTITVWVALDDPHHILKVEQAGGDCPAPSRSPSSTRMLPSRPPPTTR